jgi:predicted outer membrane protein
MGRPEGLWFALVAAITVVIGGCSKMEGTKPASSEEPGGRPGAVGAGGAGASVRSDGDFVRDVVIKNMAEIELSRIALDHATSLDIKSFAQRMIDDHGGAGTKLKSLVSGQPIEWPGQLDDKHRKTADELAQKQGAEFDRDYVKAMVDGHQDLTAKLESRLDVQSLADWKTAAAGRTHNKDLPDPTNAMRDVQVHPDKSNNENTMKINQWAAETYPIAQKHLDTARTLENVTKKRSTN